MRVDLDSLLTVRIESIDRSCGLTELQKKKLRLAGRGDIKRFFDKIDEKRAKVVNTKHDQAQANAIFQEVQQLQFTYNSGVFGDASIFAKTVKKTLTDEQSSDYEQALREKQAFRYRTRVELMVATVGNNLGLSSDQRRRFVKLVLEETRPPKNLGHDEYLVTMLQAAKLPDEKLKAILDNAQWRALSRQFAQARAMERVLINNGYDPDDAAGEQHAKPENPAPKTFRGR
jgi:hypothetical protein